MKSQTNKKPSWYQLFQKPVLFIGVLLLLLGIYSYLNTTKGLFPEVEFPRITLIANAGQQPVDRMMITVTKPLESAVKKVPGVTLVKSVTSRGSTQIDVFFQWGGDIYGKKAQLESRVNEIKNFLPQGTVISTEVMNQSLYPVYGFTLKSKTHSQIEMRDVANLIVRPLFSQVDGISNVVVNGGKAKEFVIIPDAQKMSALGITPQAIKQAFQQTNFIESNGQVAGYQRLYLTLTDTRIQTLQQLEKIIMAHPEVATYSRRTAMGMSFSVKPTNYGDYLIQLKPNHKESTPQVISDLRREINAKVPVMIMVVGIIAENAIFTLNQYDMNRKAGGSVSESVDYAIALRIRPKLMTAISAILALMPLALGFGLGAQMQQPLAIAVIGGFCVALPLLLVVLPTMMLKIMKCDE